VIQWLPLAEFQDQKYLSERKMMKRMLDVCIETTKAPACKGFRIENVQAGSPRGPQYFYNNSGSWPCLMRTGHFLKRIGWIHLEARTAEVANVAIGLNFLVPDFYHQSILVLKKEELCEGDSICNDGDIMIIPSGTCQISVCELNSCVVILGRLWLLK